MNLVAAVEHAAGPYPRTAWQIGAAMFGWLNRRHNRAQWVALYTLAIDAAERAGDPAGEALIAGRLAVAHSQLGLTDNAIVACERAYRLRNGLGDRLGAATALLNLGAVYLDRREPERPSSGCNAPDNMGYRDTDELRALMSMSAMRGTD